METGSGVESQEENPNHFPFKVDLQETPLEKYSISASSESRQGEADFIDPTE